MRFKERRLNRANLRPRLQNIKKRHEKAQSEISHPVPITHADEAALPRQPADARPRRLEASSRSIRPLRPAIRTILTPPTNLATLEGIRGNEVVSTRSTASFWGIILVILSILAWGAGFVIGFQASLVVLLVFGLVLCVAGLASPSLGVLALGMVAALDAVANIFLFTGGLLRYNTVNYWLLLVILLFIPFILRLNDLNSRTLQIFLALMLLELTFSTDKSSGIQDILNIGVTFGMVVYFARGLEDELSFYWLGIVNGVLAGLGGLVFYLQIDKLPYANPNDWTYFQLTALFSICIAYPFAIKYKKSRLALLLLAALNFTWVFLSGSRGSLLIALLSAVFLFLTTRNLTWKVVMITIAFAAGAWISLNFTAQQITTISRIQLLFDTTQTAARRTSERSRLAQAGLDIFKKNPMGIGTGSFSQASITTGLFGSQRPAHSAWIQVLAENGVLGVLLLAIFIGSYAIVGFRKAQEHRLLFALFITIVFAGAFVAKEFRGKSLWFLAASGIVLLRPEVILAQLHHKPKIFSTANFQRLKDVRFGRKR